MSEYELPIQDLSFNTSPLQQFDYFVKALNFAPHPRCSRVENPPGISLITITPARVDDFVTHSVINSASIDLDPKANTTYSNIKSNSHHPNQRKLICFFVSSSSHKNYCS